MDLGFRFLRRVFCLVVIGIIRLILETVKKMGNENNCCSIAAKKSIAKTKLKELNDGLKE